MNVRTKLDEKYEINVKITGKKTHNFHIFYDVDEIEIKRRLSVR